MTGDALIWDLFLRGIACGCLAATGIGLAREGVNLHARIAGALFCLATITYAINSSEALRVIFAPAMPAVWVLSVAGAGYTWLFLYVLFEDQKLGWRTLAPVALLFVVGMAGAGAPDGVRQKIWIGHNLIETVLALHAILFIARSWRGDLVEARRRLRGPFLGAVAIYMIVLASFEISEAMGHDAAWHRLAGSASLAVFCLAGVVAFLKLRAGLFGRVTAPAAAAPEPVGDPQDRVIAGRLAAAMEKDALWRTEGLTIGTLAETLGAPEHRVRRVINGHLGHRNFAAFVNAHRIEAAKAALAAPDNATRTVAAIAFDLGFGSLGPFNRAFKDATGLTPTEFRNQTLQSAPPNPGNPR